MQSANILPLNASDDIIEKEEPTEITRPTEELIIGLVGPVGSGVSCTAEELRDMLQNEYGYNATIIRISDLIRRNADKTEIHAPAAEGSQRIIDLQAVGTQLRNKFGNDYLAFKVIEEIALIRANALPDALKFNRSPPARRATIVDSLKRPEESLCLRRVYGGIYWQISVFAPEEVREKRLGLRGVERSTISQIFTRDEDDPLDHGQQVANTAFLSDFFVRNDRDNTDELKGVLGGIVAEWRLEA